MKMKALIAPVGLLLLMGACSRTPVSHVTQETPQAKTSDRVPETQVGRYQLLAGEHLIVGKKAVYNDKDVFRIDTVTGKTDVYISGGGDNYWSEIKDSPRAAPVNPGSAREGEK